MAQESAPTTTPLPDPLETLTEELRLKMAEGVVGGGGEYEQGVRAGLFAALELVEREQQHQREIDEEHVPGRVYGPLGEA